MDYKKNNIFKNVWNFFHSMRFGIILLILISIFSVFGSIIPQNNPIEHYEHSYNSFIYSCIEIFQLNNVFTSWIFIFMIVLLSLNLVLCSVRQFPSIRRKMNKSLFDLNLDTKEVDFYIVGKLDLVVEKLGYRNIDISEDNNSILLKKNTIGYLGAFLTHISLLIIILSFTFGRITGFNTYIYGVPGTENVVEDTDYIVKINDFNIEFRDDYTVNQYISDIDLVNEKSGYVKKGYVKVNKPFRGKGINVYQNGTGWALDISVFKDGELLSDRTLYQSEIFVEDNKNIAIEFVNFYPDYDNLDGIPKTLSPFLNNPKLLYTIYYGGFRVDMNIVSPGETINFREYSFKVEDPQMFTLLQVVRDLGNIPAVIGGLLLILGVYLSFYMIPKEVILRKKDNGVEIIINTSKNIDITREEIIRKLNLKEDDYR